MCLCFINRKNEDKERGVVSCPLLPDTRRLPAKQLYYLQRVPNLYASTIITHLISHRNTHQYTHPSIHPVSRKQEQKQSRAEQTIPPSAMLKRYAEQRKHPMKVKAENTPVRYATIVLFVHPRSCDVPTLDSTQALPI